MTDRPILFSAPMIRAILSGQKTQTRRVVKPEPTSDSHRYTPGDLLMAVATGYPIRCPYGDPGDRLWVREAFSGDHSQEANPPALWNRTTPFWYWADGSPSHGDWTKPRPSIHMPRWASRITLEITGVRVERLQDISEADALAEGIVPQHGGGFGLPAGEHYHALDPRISYWSLWDAINGAGSVEANPWVWVVEFERALADETQEG